MWISTEARNRILRRWRKYSEDNSRLRTENARLREALRECVTHVEDLRGTILNEFSREQWDSTPQLELILKEFGDDNE